MTRLFAAASMIALASPAIAQDPTFDPDRLSEHVRIFSSDYFEGRAPGTAGEDRAVGYITGAMVTAGLQPGGDVDPATGKRGFTQDVVLAKSVMLDPPIVSLRMGDSAMDLEQNVDVAVRAPINGEAHVEIQDAPLVFVGYGADAPERDWDDYKDQDLTGKVLVMLVNDPDFEGGEGDFGGKEMTYYGRWTYKYEEAARRGAAGVMVIHETAPASYGWNVVANGNDETLDIVRDDPKAAHTGFESWISSELAEKLFANAGTSLAAAKKAAQKRNFQPIDLGAALDATLLTETSELVTKNVVGMLPGKAHKDEYVAYSAHYDHLGVAPKPDDDGDSIYNGALDNATGVAMLIEQSRAFAQAGPQDRSLLFLAVGAEESGLLGSKYYAANPLYPLGKTVAVINTDSQGVFGRAKDFSISGTARLGLLDMLIAEGKKMGKSFIPDPRPEAGGFFRSDHFAFALQGVPAVSFKAGQDLEDGGVERSSQLSADYVSKLYHQVGDEWAADWNFEGIVQDSVLLHRVGMRLANERVWPNWAEGSEFRSVRDESAASRQ